MKHIDELKAELFGHLKIQEIVENLEQAGMETTDNNFEEREKRIEELKSEINRLTNGAECSR